MKKIKPKSDYVVAAITQAQYTAMVRQEMDVSISVSSCLDLCLPTFLRVLCIIMSLVWELSQVSVLVG